MAVRIRSLETQIEEALELTKLRNDTVGHYKEENRWLKENIDDLKKKTKKARTDDQNLLDELRECLLEHSAEKWNGVQEAVQRTVDKKEKCSFSYTLSSIPRY